MSRPDIRNILWLSAVIHLLAAFFNDGFFHYDEHFQILEFVNWKLGGAETVDSWQFNNHIRPWLQPALYTALLKVLRAVSGPHPFFEALFLRLFSATISFVAMLMLIPKFETWFKSPKLQAWAVFLFSSLWFIPFIHVRPTSETLSTALFVMGFALAVREGPIQSVRAIYMGLCFGLAFQFRFHIGMMIAGIGCWLLWHRKLKAAPLVMMILAFVTFGAVGFAIDSWGYETPDFVLWRYFQDLFVHGVLESDGVEPWWFFLKYAALNLPPVSTLLVFAALIGFWRERQHPITWACVPMILFHSLVGHKEPRYLFPVFLLGSVMPLYATNPNRLLQLINLRHGWVRVFVAINLIVLVHLAVTTRKRQMSVYEFATSYAQKTNRKFEYYFIGDDPFHPAGLRPNFYLGDKVVKMGEFWGEVTVFQLEHNRPILLVKEGPLQTDKAKGACQLLWDNYPLPKPWPVLDRILERTKVRSWFIYECKNEAKTSLHDHSAR